MSRSHSDPGPVAMWNFETAWVLLEGGICVRVGCDGGVSGGDGWIDLGMLFEGTPAWFVSTSLPAGQLRGITFEDDEEGFASAPPAEFEPLEPWILEKAGL